MIRLRKFAVAASALSLALVSCASKKEANQKFEDSFAASDRMASIQSKADNSPEPSPAVMAPEEALLELEGDSFNDEEVAGGPGYRAKKESPKPSAPDQDVEGGLGASELGPAPRAWFPETFLFQPLVVTDDAGAAEVKVRVPDRLTTWRVLGLAHSRSGAQAGASATFEGTLPAYVDPVVPSFLRAGDSVRIPIALINNSPNALQTSLNVQVHGGTIKSKSQSVSIPASSSTVRYVDVSTELAGELRLMARMGEQDMVVRSIDVLPTGRPIVQSQSGTLASPRSFAITGAEAASGSKGIARLSVFPGALALLRSELSASIHRGGMASDVFSLLLAGKAPELLRVLGDTPDEEALRKLKITSTQKVIKHARVLDISTATLIAEATRSHSGDPVLERLAARAISTIESSQAPDGTCGGQSGMTLQRLLVSTADCARAAPDSPNVVIRAAGAFERHAKEISDPYTAAAILAARGASGELAETLRKLVLDSIEDRANGAKVLVFPSGVLRADGQAPSQIEATALAVLALRDQPGAPLADLGASILASYSPYGGWGDGRANLLCMEAAVELFRDPLPETVAITLTQDGRVVAEGLLERDKVRELLELKADGLDIGGAHDWSIRAEPAVPGLGFSLALTNWIPWTAEPSLGTELVLELPKTMQVGEAVALGVTAIAPSGVPFSIDIQLPAGAVVDTQSLDRLVDSGSLERFKSVDGRVSLQVRPLAAAQRFAATIRIIPTLAGSLQSGPTTIEVRGQIAHVPPTTWVVR